MKKEKHSVLQFIGRMLFGLKTSDYILLSGMIIFGLTVVFVGLYT